MNEIMIFNNPKFGEVRTVNENGKVLFCGKDVAAALGYYARFLEALPTVEALAAVPEDRLMKLWEGLGYYSRARNLQKAARLVVERGGFPDTYQGLLALPGIGDYTAGAIASAAFGRREAAVDGNVLRVVTRLTDDHSDVALPQTKKAIRSQVQNIFPEAKADTRIFNQSLMELGATVCLPNGAPLCHRCPAAEFCAAHLTDCAQELPVKPPKKARKVEERTVYLIFRSGRVALRRRPARGLLAGLWEYPNELASESGGLRQWGLSAPVLERAGTGIHIFSHVEWRMTALTGELAGPELPEGWVWADRNALRDVYAVPNAFQSFAQQVAGRLGRFV